jgi:hypothetical protein
MEVQDGDKTPHRDASVWRRPSRLGALDSIILLPLSIEMRICIHRPSEVAPSSHLPYEVARSWNIKNLTERCSFFKIGCFRFHNLCTSEDRDADLHPSTLGGGKIMEYKATHWDDGASFTRCSFSILCEVLPLNRSLTLMIADFLQILC